MTVEAIWSKHSFPTFWSWSGGTDSAVDGVFLTGSDLPEAAFPAKSIFEGLTMIFERDLERFVC